MNEDVIIVLGIGINLDGTLPKIGKIWVEKAVSLFNEGMAEYILMSGAWSFWLENKPPRTEASAMKEYALELGVPEESILIEEKSKDTIGNIYFSKVDFLEPNDWTDIIVVCSNYRRERTGYLLSKILGDDYKFSFANEPSESQRDDIDDLINREKASLSGARKWLDSIDDGNTEAIKNFLYTVHPGYADNPVVTKEKLKEIKKKEWNKLD